MNCAIIGAVLAELSLRSRIDTDRQSLKVLDPTETGNPVLAPILEKIANEPVEHDVQYWIERLVFGTTSLVDLILDRLVELKILDFHDGDFWTLGRTAWQTEVFADSHEGTAVEFVKMRVSRAIFDNEIPAPRDVIIIGLLNTCDVLRFIFQLDGESEERIRPICRMNLIGRSVSDAVTQNLAAHLLQRPAFSKPIPAVPLHRLLANEHVRDGRLPALFADLAAEHGPSQPSAPITQISERSSPASVSSISERVRRKSTSNAAISSSASPMSGSIPCSVACLYSSSITTGEMLLARNEPSAASAASLIVRSAISMRSSPVSRSRTMATATCVPSASVPDIAASAS